MLQHPCPGSRFLLRPLSETVKAWDPFLILSSVWCGPFGLPILSSGGTGLAKRLLLLGALSLLGVLLLGCEALGIGKVDNEAELLDPPSVSTVFKDAEDLRLCPADLLERRRDSAREDLTELYNERMDDAPSERAIERLRARLDRALGRLDDNYEDRLDRVVDRRERTPVTWKDGCTATGFSSL